MVPGFNHNIQHNGKLYHIQTEDSGIGTPHIITLLYIGGTIISREKTSYADIIKIDNLEEIVKDLMQEQHKRMLRKLIGGEFDETKKGDAQHTKPAVEKQAREEDSKLKTDDTPEKSLNDLMLDFLSDEDKKDGAA